MINDKFEIWIDFETVKTMDSINDPGYIEIAKVHDCSIKKDVMYVLYDKNKLNTESKYLMYTMIIDGTWFAIMGEEEFFRFKKNIKNSTFSIYHELGHFINGDYADDKHGSTRELAQKRRECILNGEVLEMELKADEFAVKQVGKSTAINSLDYSIKRRKELDNSKLAIKELELRKKHIQKMKL